MPVSYATDLAGVGGKSSLFHSSVCCLVSMEIHKREMDGIPILDVVGEMVIYDAHELKTVVIDLMAQKKNRIMVNMEKVVYIDSSGIGALVASLSALKKERGGLAIVNVHGVVKDVFTLTRLHQLFSIFDSEEEAVQSLTDPD